MEQNTTILIVEPNGEYHESLKACLDAHGCAGLYMLSGAAPKPDEKNRPVIIIGVDENGEYDCISTPYKVGVLVDKVRGAIQKTRVNSQHKIGPYTLHVRDLLLANDKGGEPISLTHREVEILEMLIHATEPIPKQRLLEMVWGYGENIETHTLETHIYRLRQKMERDPSSPEYLVTTDQGYMLKS